MNRIIPKMIRRPLLFFTPMIVLMLFAVENIHAQESGGWFRQNNQFQNRRRLFPRFQPAHSHRELSSTNRAIQASDQPIRKQYDPRFWRDPDADSRYPKFIGGFHSSHFTNVGIPSGDIGFRGNGIYWAPW